MDGRRKREAIYVNDREFVDRTRLNRIRLPSTAARLPVMQELEILARRFEQRSSGFLAAAAIAEYSQRWRGKLIWATYMTEIWAIGERMRCERRIAGAHRRAIEQATTSAKPPKISCEYYSSCRGSFRLPCIRLRYAGPPAGSYTLAPVWTDYVCPHFRYLNNT